MKNTYRQLTINNNATLRDTIDFSDFTEAFPVIYWLDPNDKDQQENQYKKLIQSIKRKDRSAKAKAYAGDLVNLLNNFQPYLELLDGIVATLEFTVLGDGILTLKLETVTPTVLNDGSIQLHVQTAKKPCPIDQNFKETYNWKKLKTDKNTTNH